MSEKTQKAKQVDSIAKLRARWRNMKRRCSVEKQTGYKYYGGKGINVCKEWEESFIVFKKWAFENGYRVNLQLDRIDNNGNYSPENCRFVTQKTNLRNRSITKLSFNSAGSIRNLYASGKYTKTGLGKMFGVTRQTVTSVIKNEIWVQSTRKTMTKEKIIENLRSKMRNQAIDLIWVQEKALEELENDINELLGGKRNCGGLKNRAGIDIAVMNKA